MKTLILYHTVTGFTKKCTDYLHSNIDDSKVSEVDSTDFSLDDYDKVLIGAPIYYGKINKKVVKFIKINEKQLLKKELGFYFSGMLEDDFNKTLQTCLPAEIFYHAKVVHNGGAYDFDKLNFIQKLFVKRLTKTYETTEDFREDQLKKLI